MAAEGCLHPVHAEHTYQVQDAARQILAKLNPLNFDKLYELDALLGTLRKKFAQGHLHHTLQEATNLLRATRSREGGRPARS